MRFVVLNGRSPHLVKTRLRMNARRLALGISLLLVLGAAASARAQPAPRIPLKDFFDNPKISSAAISPDGRQLAFLAPERNRMNVWVDSNGDVRACTAQVGTKTQIRVRDSASGSFRTLATYTDEESPSVHGFSADGTYLYFSSARDANAERLVKLDLKTGKETLIDADPEYDLSGVFISDRTNQLLGVAYNKERLIYLRQTVRPGSRNSRQAARGRNPFPQQHGR